MPLFLFIFHILHTFSQAHSYNTFIRLSISSSLVSSLGKTSLELGPALQQADALPTEPRRTPTEPRRTDTSILLGIGAISNYYENSQRYSNLESYASVGVV
jgi:hypothetical protein